MADMEYVALTLINSNLACLLTKTEIVCVFQRNDTAAGLPPDGEGVVVNT